MLSVDSGGTWRVSWNQILDRNAFCAPPFRGQTCYGLMTGPVVRALRTVPAGDFNAHRESPDLSGSERPLIETQCHVSSTRSMRAVQQFPPVRQAFRANQAL